MLEADVAVVVDVVVAEDAGVHHRQEAAVEAVVEEREERGEVLVATRSATSRAERHYILIAYPFQHPPHSHSFLHTQPSLTASSCHNRPPLKNIPSKNVKVAVQ